MSKTKPVIPKLAIKLEPHSIKGEWFLTFKRAGRDAEIFWLSTQELNRLRRALK